MLKKQIVAFLSVIAAVLMSAAPVFAHAIVKPAQAGIGSYTDFSLGVPAEKDNVSVTSVKLMLPVGLQSISPVVKPGWQVEVKEGPVPAGVKLAPDDDGNVPMKMPAEIDWTGGSIPSGQKDYFSFTAQVPSKPIELDWKVTQTYSDGSSVSWSLGPKDPQPKDKDGKPDYSSFGPYSKTMVVNDLKGKESNSQDMTMSASGDQSISQGSGQVNFPLVISGLALVLSAIAVGITFKKG